MNGWFAMVAPAGTPLEVVRRLNRDIGEYLKVQKSNSGFWSSDSRPKAPARPRALANSFAKSKTIGGLWPRNWPVLTRRGGPAAFKMALSVARATFILSSALRRSYVDGAPRE
jgi:hypothetical protein